ELRLAFHLGPDVDVHIDGSCAALRWPTAVMPGEARLELPGQLRWSLHKGETAPILGWYSPGLGRRVPAFTLLGRGRCAAAAPLISRMEFLDVNHSAMPAVTTSAVSWSASDAAVGEAPGIPAEAG